MCKQEENFFHLKLKKKTFLKNNNVHRYTYKNLLKMFILLKQKNANKS